MKQPKKYSTTYRMLKGLGFNLSAESYGDISLGRMIGKVLVYWKNEILQKIARNSVLLAPLNARKIRPMLHKWRGVNIGKNAFIGWDVMIDSIHPKRVHIGNNVSLLNRVQIIAHHRDIRNYNRNILVSDTKYIVKDTIIEDGAYIMTNSMILTGVRVGKGAIVAAGSIVTKDVEPYTLVAGIPAKVIRHYT